MSLFHTASIDELADPPYAAAIGLDWADQEHFWSMKTADGKITRGQLSNTPEAIDVWAAELAQRFESKPVAVALEQSRGAVIAMLCKYGHIVLFPVHPNTVANYRKSFAPSGAKGDASDGDLILDLLVKHPDRLRRLRPDTVETRQLQFLTEERRKLVNQRTAELQQLISWLKQIFPQILRWFGEPASPLVRDVLLRWPTLKELQKARPQTLLKFFHQHNCRNEKLIQTRLAEIGQAVEATTDAALLKTATLCIQNCVRILAQMQNGIAEFDRQILEVYRTHPDRALVESFPGAGPALEPRLIAAAGSMRDRFESADSLACYTGIAPVTESSGKSRWVHWRWACPKFIRQTFHEWARCSIRTCAWARAYYDQQRDKGKGHHAALRALAFKWIRIFFRCWRDRVPYSESLCRQAQVLSMKQQPRQAQAGVQLAWETCGSFSKPTKLSS